jgi:hypothetical protein
MLQPGACVGKNSCANIGERKAEAVTIQSEACVGDNSCRAIGWNIAESVLIYAGACVGPDVCGGDDFPGIYGDIAGPNVQQCFAEETPTCQTVDPVV